MSDIKQPIGYLFELCYSHDHDRWSGTMYSSHLPNPSDIRNVQPLYAHPPTDAGVSEMRAELDLARKALEMCSGALQTVALSEKIPESRTFTFVDKWESLGTVRLGTILDTVNEAIARARALAPQDEGEERT